MNATEPTKARPFDVEDWNGFAGAEPWGDPLGDDPGAQPLVREFDGPCLGIADRDGAELYFGSDADWTEQTIFRIDRPHATQAEAREFLESLPSDVTPEAAISDFGFFEV
jgi:hypothetical protein